MWKTTVWASAILALWLVGLCESAKILCLMTSVTRSHHIFNRRFTLALAKRGHQVTVFAPDQEKKPSPNHREILIEGAYEAIQEAFDYESFAEMDKMTMVAEVFNWGLVTCRHTLNSEGARQLLELAKNETFDLIITEFVVQECVLGFVSKFGNPPVIGITGYPGPPWAYDLMGNFQNPSYVNTYILPLTDHMTFTQRMQNFLLDTYVWLYRRFLYMPEQDKLSRKFFGDSTPLPSEVEKNVSFVMVNTHFSTDYPKPLVPAVIEIGGLQAKPPQPLPKDLKEFLDSAKDGAIFMSLGTNVRSDKLGEASRRAFLEAFQELPQKVLWKWESDSLPGQPPNVNIIKWAPQNDILAHPNVKVFISHGGMLSTTEAVYHGVPVVGVPFLLDQYANLRKNVAKGAAVELDTLRLTKESVLEALHKVLEDPSYEQRMKQLSAIYRDRPQTALETAVWWTEYALRHQGAPHLRCASLDLHWFQRWLLDVIAFLLLAAAAASSALYLLLRKVLSALFQEGGKLKRS
ncbi:UDP-glucosyltransferase 2-like [Schistocerca serialis cubense]|uniref:UDP-glucosyltransferase 2-like n=1 Tax=Schistocerca serialis cubense TaxID=2023355 RepID=UPI00214EE31E|nr:UDP-glucosyltransferase 2-like [Schistocerca serialis cubense]